MTEPDDESPVAPQASPAEDPTENSATAPRQRRRDRAADPVDKMMSTVEAAVATEVPRPSAMPDPIRYRPRYEFVDHRGSGFDDPTLIAGRPRSSWVHIPALMLAFGADIGAFSQVIALVMRDQPEALVYLVVAGFSAVVLYLAHVAGTMLRDRKAGLAWVRGVVAWVCLLVWAGLGAIAFYIRLVTPPSAGAPSVQFDDASSVTTSSSEPHSQATLAVVFAALYVATGLVAAVGAYLTHNPLRGAYSATQRAHRRATRRAARTVEKAFLASADRLTQMSRFASMLTVLGEEAERRREQGEELKQHARVVMATATQDPAVTDAVFDPDRRPYSAMPDGNGWDPAPQPPPDDHSREQPGRKD